MPDRPAKNTGFPSDCTVGKAAYLDDRPSRLCGTAREGEKEPSHTPKFPSPPLTLSLSTSLAIGYVRIHFLRVKREAFVSSPDAWRSEPEISEIGRAVGCPSGCTVGKAAYLDEKPSRLWRDGARGGEGTISYAEVSFSPSHTLPLNFLGYGQPYHLEELIRFWGYCWMLLLANRFYLGFTLFPCAFHEFNPIFCPLQAIRGRAQGIRMLGRRRRAKNFPVSQPD